MTYSTSVLNTKKNETNMNRSMAFMYDRLGNVEFIEAQMVDSVKSVVMQRAVEKSNKNKLH